MDIGDVPATGRRRLSATSIVIIEGCMRNCNRRASSRDNIVTWHPVSQGVLAKSPIHLRRLDNQFGFEGLTSSRNDSVRSRALFGRVHAIIVECSRVLVERSGFTILVIIIPSVLVSEVTIVPKRVV